MICTFKNGSMTETIKDFLKEKNHESMSVKNIL